MEIFSPRELLDSPAVDYQMRMEYDASSNPIYIGFGNMSAGAGDESWVIFKLFYDENGNMVWRQRRTGSWTNRSSLSWLS